MPYQVICGTQSDFGSSLGIGGGGFNEHMRVIEKQVFIFFVGMISPRKGPKKA